MVRQSHNKIKMVQAGSVSSVSATAMSSDQETGTTIHIETVGSLRPHVQQASDVLADQTSLARGASVQAQVVEWELARLRHGKCNNVLATSLAAAPQHCAAPKGALGAVAELAELTPEPPPAAGTVDQLRVLWASAQLLMPDHAPLPVEQLSMPQPGVCCQMQF